MSRWLLALMLMTTVLPAAESEIGDMATSITVVKSKHESRLLSLPGVISVGIGRADDGSSVIVIGVKDKASAESQSLPRQLDGYPVRVDVIGSVKAQ